MTAEIGSSGAVDSVRSPERPYVNDLKEKENRPLDPLASLQFLKGHSDIVPVDRSDNAALCEWTHSLVLPECTDRATAMPSFVKGVVKCRNN